MDYEVFVKRNLDEKVNFNPKQLVAEVNAVVQPVDKHFLCTFCLELSESPV